MGYWSDWARQVAKAAIEQENEAEIEQSIEQTAVNVNEQSNVVVIGDKNTFEGGVVFDLTNVNDQDIEQEAEQEAEIEQENDNDGFVVAANVATDDVTVII
jgi:L-lactate utilization protein LutC